MKFLLDQCVPRSLRIHLGELGIPSIHVAELGLSRILDAAILEYAEREGYTVITFDSDFHALLAKNQSCRPSVIRVRDEWTRTTELAHTLNKTIRATSDDIESGCAITLSKNRVRIRKLPFGGSL